MINEGSVWFAVTRTIRGRVGRAMSLDIKALSFDRSGTLCSDSHMLFSEDVQGALPIGQVSVVMSRSFIGRI